MSSGSADALHHERCEERRGRRCERKAEDVEGAMAAAVAALLAV